MTEPRSLTECLDEAASIRIVDGQTARQVGRLYSQAFAAAAQEGIAEGDAAFDDLARSASLRANSAAGHRKAFLGTMTDEDRGKFMYPGGTKKYASSGIAGTDTVGQEAVPG